MTYPNLVVITSDNVTVVRGDGVLHFVARTVRRLCSSGFISKKLDTVCSEVDKTVTLIHPVTGKVVTTYKVTK